MWNNINNLTNLASLIQWFAIILVVLGALLQGGKYFIDKRINSLKEKDQQTKEILRIETEKKYNNQIDILKLSLGDSKNEIEALKKKTAYVDPYTQPIQTCTATVSIIVQSNEHLEGHYGDVGGYLTFIKGNSELLVLSNDECYAIFIAPDQVIFKGVFNLDANHPSIGKRLTYLRDAEYLKIHFDPIEKDYNVIEGEAICTFNGNARMKFTIPKQIMQNKIVFVRNISSTFNEIFQ